MINWSGIVKKVIYYFYITPTEIFKIFNGENKKKMFVKKRKKIYAIAFDK